MLLLGALTVVAQEYEATVQNQSVQPGGVYQFDIYVRRIGTTTWRMADATFQFTFNTSAFTTLAVTYVSGSTGLGSSYTVAPDVTTLRINIEVQPPTTYASSTEISDAGTRIGTFRLSTISNAAANADLTWRVPLISYQAMGERLADDNFHNITNGSTASYPAIDNIGLPITLASFGVVLNPSGPGVRLDWSTISEVNNYGFYSQRKGEGEAEFADLAGSFVPGNGTTAKPQTYSYTDNSITNPGRYSYRLRQVDLDGNSHFSSAVGIDVLVTSVKELAPIEFALLQNYPNPFNPETIIKFSVEATGPATLRLYNAIGQEVAALFDDVAEAGTYYRVRLNSSHLATGVYYYRLESGKRKDIKKLVLMK